MELDEKMQKLITQYQGCYDLAIARLKVSDLTNDEFEIIQEDEFFIASINSIDADIQERLLNNLIVLSSSQNESIKMKATLELGKILYDKKFNKTKNNNPDDELRRKPTIVLVGKYPGDGNAADSKQDSESNTRS